MKTELTIEESAKLVELGVYPEWAKPYVERGSTPIITLEYILDELLPKEIHGSNLEMGYSSEFKQWWAGYKAVSLKSAPLNL